MAFGQYLRDHLYLLTDASTNKFGDNAFWAILKRIAVQDILLLYPSKIDSYTAVPIYFEILTQNRDKLPSYFSERLESNNQERYRVINRNLFTSNAFHPDGLANQKEIKAYRTTNFDKKGECIIFQGVEEYVNK